MEKVTHIPVRECGNQRLKFDFSILGQKYFILIGYFIGMGLKGTLDIPLKIILMDNQYGNKSELAHAPLENITASTLKEQLICLC